MYRLVLDFFIKLSFTFLKKNKLRLILNYLSPKKNVFVTFSSCLLVMSLLPCVQV